MNDPKQQKFGLDDEYVRELPRRHDRKQALTFSAAAWLKLQYFCHKGHTEIGGFGVATGDDLLYIDEFHTVKQRGSQAFVSFDDDGIADFTDACVDRGLKPQQFLRIWCHTHPIMSANPSGVDESTFKDSFGACDWAVMFILSRTEDVYARIRFSAGPGAEMLLPVQVDWSGWPQQAVEQFTDAFLVGWEAEFEKNVASGHHLYHTPRHHRGWPDGDYLGHNYSMGGGGYATGSPIHQQTGHPVNRIIVSDHDKEGVIVSERRIREETPKTAEDDVHDYVRYIHQLRQETMNGNKEAGEELKELLGDDHTGKEVGSPFEPYGEPGAIDWDAVVEREYQQQLSILEESYAGHNHSPVHGNTDDLRRSSAT